MFFIPKSSLASTLDPTAANFPALAHFFPCDEATGTLTLTDSVGGVVLAQSSGSGITNNANGTVSWTATAMNIIQSGAWTPPGTKNIVLITIGKPTNSSTSVIGIGSTAAASNKGFSATAQSTGVMKVANGTTLINTSGTPAAGTPAWTASGANAAWVNSIILGSAGGTTGQQPFNFDGTNWGVQTPADCSAITTIATLDATVSFGVSVNPYMIAVLYFDVMPTDLKAGVEWMYHYATSAGNIKTIYPGWTNRS